MSEQNKLLAVLREEIENIDKAKEVLAYSFSMCQKIGIKASYNKEEEVEFEALTSRFSRLCDILIQKAWRALFITELEEDGSIRDRLNRAEKKGLIDSADVFIDIRLLRNRIAHDYNLDDMSRIYKEVFACTPLLLGAIAKLHEYVKAQKLFEL